MTDFSGNQQDPGSVLKNAYREHSDKTGALAVQTMGSFVSEKYDYVGVSYPNGTTEVYSYKTGGASGTLVATVTVSYVDTTKEQISSVART